MPAHDRQRHAVFAGGLHPGGGHRPDFGRNVDFRPQCAENFAGSRRRKNAKRKCLRGNRVVGSQPGHQHRDIGVGHRGMMATRKLLALKEQVREVAAPPRGVLSRTIALRLGCVEHGLNSSTQPRGSLRLRGPQRLQDCEHSFRPDLVDWTRPKFDRSLCEAPAPLLAVFLVAPLMRLRLKQCVRNLAERSLVSCGAVDLPCLDGIVPRSKDASSLISGGAGLG